FLHLRRVHIMFAPSPAYSVRVVNWHARETPPKISEARAEIDTCLACGSDAWNTLPKGTPDGVAAEVRDAVAQTEGRGHIVTTGCVMPIDTPEANIRAAIAAARGG